MGRRFNPSKTKHTRGNMNALNTVTKFENGNDTLLHVFPTSILLTKYLNSLKDVIKLN